MIMVATAYETANDCPETVIVEILVAGFSGQLKGWWDNYLTEGEKHLILTAIKKDSDGIPILNEGESIADAVNTLIFTIAQHFIGDPSLFKDRSGELLSNLKCRTLGDFRWYKDTFLTRVYTRDDSHQPFWKEKFLAGLPTSLGDKVREKLRGQNPHGDIPYHQLSYGQLIAYIQKVALKICQDDKIQKQLAKEKSINRKDMGTFCEQFGLPCTKKEKSKPKHNHPRPKFHRNRPHKKYDNEAKPDNQFPFNNFPRKARTNAVCYNCKKPGHISKYCRLKGKLKALNLDQEIEERINNLLIETSDDDDSIPESSKDLNQIKNDDLFEDESGSSSQINVLTKDQDLLFEAINAITDPQVKKAYLERLKSSLVAKPTNNPLVANKFNLTDTFKRLEKATSKPVTIQDLQHEINNLKIEIRELKQTQNNHHLILEQLNHYDSIDDNPAETDPIDINQNFTESHDRQEEEDFLGLINQLKIQNFYINIKIIIKEFVLETTALFGTGVDSNCILEGLIPTIYMCVCVRYLNFRFLLLFILKDKFLFTG
jgi:hypothetical protein